jgi:F-box domain
VIISIEGMDAKPCYDLTRLPLELLAEILLYMPSTKCVLALARCSKYFCATLVNNGSSVFIWRRVRATCKPKVIPDPTPDFTEPAYAAFIFDGGQCEVRDWGFFSFLPAKYNPLKSRYASDLRLKCTFLLHFVFVCAPMFVV